VIPGRLMTMAQVFLSESTAHDSSCDPSLFIFYLIEESDSVEGDGEEGGGGGRAGGGSGWWQWWLS
jgi:hypothetical protein